MPKMFSPSKMFLKKFFAHENMKKRASKVAEPAQIQPKSQFLFYKNLPPQDFSIMTVSADCLILWGNSWFTRVQGNPTRAQPLLRTPRLKNHIYIT